MLSWIVRLLNKVSHGLNSCDQSSSPKERNSLLLIITSLFLLPVGLAIFLGTKLSNWSTLFLYGCWHRLPRKPPSIDQTFNNLLLTKVKLEQRVAYVSQLLWVRAAVKVSPKSFQDKETAGGESHLAMLCYYRVERIPGTLAIVRYDARNRVGAVDWLKNLGVAEDRFDDTPDDFCRLQDDVQEALLTGVDVCVMSPYEPETFEGINQFISGGTVDH